MAGMIGVENRQTTGNYKSSRNTMAESSNNNVHNIVFASLGLGSRDHRERGGPPRSALFGAMNDCLHGMLAG